MSQLYYSLFVITVLFPIGYLLGGLVVSTVLFTTKMAQPALLYLCPLTLGTTVLCAYLRGGLTELRSLWAANLPTPTLIFDGDSGNASGSGDVSGVMYRLPDGGGMGSPNFTKKAVNGILLEPPEPSVRGGVPITNIGTSTPNL